MSIRTLSAAALVAVLSSTAFAADAPAKFNGGVLVDAKGMTLYTFDKDVADSGKSVCVGACATLWPPATAAASDAPAGAFGIVTREDGARQWSHRGKPLYTYQADRKAGDKNGDNFKDVWHVIKE